jgi:hypothetical protein
MTNVHHSHNPLKGARVAYEALRRKDPALPALIAGSGELRTNGRMLATFERVHGSSGVIGVAPSVTWRYALALGMAGDLARDFERKIARAFDLFRDTLSERGEAT